MGNCYARFFRSRNQSESGLTESRDVFEDLDFLFLALDDITSRKWSSGKCLVLIEWQEAGLLCQFNMSMVRM